MTMLVRCTNSAGVSQPMTANWNPAGYLRNMVELTKVIVA